MRFDQSDIPLWTLVGKGYLCLLSERPEYVRTRRQVGPRPMRADLEADGYILTQTMPAVAVHIVEGRVEDRTSQSLDWQLDVNVHCFCGDLGKGDQVRQDATNGTRALTQHVVEQLHMRIPPIELDCHGIEIQAIEHIATTPRVDWWVVRTTIMVRQEIKRQRSEPVTGAEFRQFGLTPDKSPINTTIIDFDTAVQSEEQT